MYSVFRASPPSVGFAELSTAAGGTGTAGPGSTSGSPVASGLTLTGTGTSGSSSPTGITGGMCSLLSEDLSFYLFSFPSPPQASNTAILTTTFSSFLMLSTVTTVIMLCL